MSAVNNTRGFLSNEIKRHVTSRGLLQIRCTTNYTWPFKKHFEKFKEHNASRLVFYEFSFRVFSVSLGFRREIEVNL